jgi:hypothetical protein
MAKKSKAKKRAIDMTTEDVGQAVFHPKVLKHAKRHIKRLNSESPRKSVK